MSRIMKKVVICKECDKGMVGNFKCIVCKGFGRVVIVKEIR